MRLTPDRALQMLEKSKAGTISINDITELETVFPGITRGYDIKDPADLQRLKDDLKERALQMTPKMEQTLRETVTRLTK